MESGYQKPLKLLKKNLKMSKFEKNVPNFHVEYAAKIESFIPHAFQNCARSED